MLTFTLIVHCVTALVVYTHSTLLLCELFVYVLCYRYEIMLECWQEHPNDRPTFSQLRNKFSTLLLANVDDPYMVLEVDDAKAYYNVTEEETSEQRESVGLNDSNSSLKKKGPPKKPVWAKPSNPYVDTPALSKEMSVAVTVEEETRQETVAEEVPTTTQQNGTAGEGVGLVAPSDTKNFDPYIRMQSSPAYVTGDQTQTGVPQPLQLEDDDLNQQMVSVSLPAGPSMGLSLSAMNEEKVAHKPAKRIRSNPYVDDPARRQLLEDEETNGVESKMPIISETGMAEVTAREP